MKQKLCLLTLFLLVLLLIPTRIMAATIERFSSVSVDAFIGEFRFTLFGYTSPYALVTIDGMGIYDRTQADAKGYFQFTNRFSPLSPREACLTSQDQLGRISSPVCLPPFSTKYDINIGPVIMSPTVSLNNEYYYQGDEIKLSGQTIPNSEVSFSTFVDEKKSFTQYLSSIIHNLSSIIYPKSVEAFSFPNLTTKADSKGNFSLSLPSSTPQFFRLFAQTNYENGLSPESIILNLKVLPIWMIIIQFFLWLLSLFKPRLLEIIILGEITALTIFFLRRYLHPHVIARNRALAIRQLYPILKEETDIILLNG
jgi:hypothetical protein